jgi:hypothetical protein
MVRSDEVHHFALSQKDAVDCSELERLGDVGDVARGQMEEVHCFGL